MARTLITVQEITTLDGISPTYQAFDQPNGMEFLYTGREIIHIKNTNGSGRTLTIPTPGTVDGLAIADKTISVPATTGDKMLPVKPSYVQTDGKVYLDIDAGAGVTIGVIRH